MSDDKPQSLGEAWKQARKAMTVAQDEMAARLGISESYLSLIENNRRTPPVPLLKKMAQITKRSMESLCPDPDIELDETDDE